MSRYIDADDFITNSKKHYCDGCDDYNGVRCRACWVDDMCNEVDCTPTADVVEVVRCKDCEYWDEHERCDFWSSIMSPHYPEKNDYCSYGERADA